MKTISALVFLMLLFGVPAFAGIDEDAASTVYGVKAPAMYMRGAGNLLSSPLEVLEHGYEGTKEGYPIVGTVNGLAHGIYWMLDRGGRGIWDLATFWAPRYNGAPPAHELKILS